jgi:hypothetical protein
MWAGLLLASGLALIAFWTNPLYRADDHRAAVAELAQSWRPGDVILANAGWIYPVLTTYWPDEQPSEAAGAPPPLQPPVRMRDYAQNAADLPLTTPLLVRSGSVDGSPTLGWGDPASDFFAISREQTLAALDALAGQARRIWHYRLYDTVSDPDGVIRAWLAEQTEPLTEQQIAGRDFGLVQLFGTQQATGDDLSLTRPASQPLATFGGSLALVEAFIPATVTAGSYLYADLFWQALPSLAALPADLSTSLRLYDAAGQQVAQADGPPGYTPTRAWETGQPVLQAAALPVTTNIAPGVYTLAVIVYRQDNAEPLLADATQQQMWQLGAVEILPPLAAQ